MRRSIDVHRPKLFEGGVVAHHDCIGPVHLDQAGQGATILGQSHPQQLRRRRAVRMKHRKRRLPRAPGPLVDPGFDDRHRPAATRGGQLLERQTHREIVVVSGVVKLGTPAGAADHGRRETVPLQIQRHLGFMDHRRQQHAHDSPRLYHLRQAPVRHAAFRRPELL